MAVRDDERRLLASVRRTFAAPDQVAHYVKEVEGGPDPAERSLLQCFTGARTVLDVGCGAGRVALYLAEQGFRVTGVDVSETLLGEAKRAAAERGLEVHFVQVRGTELPFGDESFDAVVAFKVYCYIPMRRNRIRYLHELARVVKPSGPVLLSQYIVPEEFFDEHKDENYYRFPGEYEGLEPGDTFTDTGGYVHWFTERDLRDELSEGPLAIEAEFSAAQYGGTEFLRLFLLRRPA